MLYFLANLFAMCDFASKFALAFKLENQSIKRLTKLTS